MLSILRDVSATYCFKNRKSFAFFKVRKRGWPLKQIKYFAGDIFGILMGANSAVLMKASAPWDSLVESLVATMEISDPKVGSL